MLAGGREVAGSLPDLQMHTEKVGCDLLTIVLQNETPFSFQQLGQEKNSTRNNLEKSWET